MQWYETGEDPSPGSSPAQGWVPRQGQQINTYTISKPEKQWITRVLFQVFPLSIQEETEYIEYLNFSFLPFFCFRVFLRIAYCPSSPGSVLSFLLQTDFNQTLDLKVPKQPTKNVFQYVKFEKSQQGLWYNTVISLTKDYYFIVNENSIWHGQEIIYQKSI